MWAHEMPLFEFSNKLLLQILDDISQDSTQYFVNHLNEL